MGEATQIASLIDPEKLATLRERGANPRIQKITAILIVAKAAGKNPEQIANQAVAKIGWGGTPAGDLTTAAILRNLDIAEKLGATTPEDIAAMRKGNAATVRRKPYAGDILSVDHVIPRSIAPELDNCIANLELMPLRLNQAKGDKIGDRQRSLARKLHAAGLRENPELPDGTVQTTAPTVHSRHLDSGALAHRYAPPPSQPGFHPEITLLDQRGPSGTCLGV
jgi:hypothetical protein